MLTAGELRAALADVPDDMPVYFYDDDPMLMHEIGEAYVDDSGPTETPPAPAVFCLESFKPERDLSGCDWFRGVGTCSFGCTDEPRCQTQEPENGWPSTRAAERIGLFRHGHLVAVLDAAPDGALGPEEEVLTICPRHDGSAVVDCTICEPIEAAPDGARKRRDET